MKTVLITGSEGFIGRNLKVTLNQRDDLQVLCFNRNHSFQELDEVLEQVDFVFHLAGVNRPQDTEEFACGNVSLTEQICKRLSELNKQQTALLISSSIQAACDNPYGLSKKAAEDAVFDYEVRSGSPCYVYRLPNVFGKWCRPNYNSVVATFCHNIANNLPIQVNDPDVTLNLAYIDDVVFSFISAMDGVLSGTDLFRSVEPVHSIKLGDMATLIRSFRSSRLERSIPDMLDGLTKKLYSTYLSYLPEYEFSYPLQMNEDERGSFTEFIRTIDRGQVSVNISKPGITKGNHWHHTKNEKFLVVSGEGVIRLRKIGEDEIINYPVSGDKLEVVDIPVGYTHDITNTGSTDMITVMWCNEPFNPDAPDTISEPVVSESGVGQ